MPKIRPAVPLQYSPSQGVNMSKFSRIILIAIFSFIALLTSGCGPNQDIIEEDAIYRYLLNDFSSPTKPIIVIRENTKVHLLQGRTLNSLFTPGKTLTQDVIDDFVAKNEKSYSLRTDMDLGHDYVLLKENDLAEFFNGDQNGWEVFREHYPESFGFFSFSRVAFNKDHTIALVYYSHQFSNEGAFGAYYVLKKESGNWVLKDCPISWKD